MNERTDYVGPVTGRPQRNVPFPSIYIYALLCSVCTCVYITNTSQLKVSNGTTLSSCFLFYYLRLRKNGFCITGHKAFSGSSSHLFSLIFFSFIAELRQIRKFGARIAIALALSFLFYLPNLVACQIASR